MRRRTQLKGFILHIARPRFRFGIHSPITNNIQSKLRREISFNGFPDAQWAIYFEIAQERKY